MKINKIITIGCLGQQTCYMNISMEEAKARYAKVYEMTVEEVTSRESIKIINFDDEFEVYDIWEI